MTTTTARTPRRRTRSAAFAVTGALTALALAGCSLGGGPSPSSTASDPATSGTSADGGTSAPASSITLVTHDSFALSEDVLAAFTDETGIVVTQVAPGDAGALVNQLVLTKSSPLGDVVYGIDNTFASRAVDEGVLAPYTSPALPASAEPYLLGDALTPIDLSDVCLNVDLAWFEENGQEPPASFDDLVQPEYAGLTVVTNPATSSPGLAFLLATISAQGEDGWVGYWEQLRDNDVLVVDGWSDAYYVDFSGAEGGGDRPIVLSYASSPPASIGDAGVPTTEALLDTCFRQVEYAGVLEGAANPEGAQAFVDFLLSQQVQADVPGQMYVYPIDSSVALPDDWAEFAPLASAPHEVPAADIAANRSDWIDTWTATVLP